MLNRLDSRFNPLRATSAQGAFDIHDALNFVWRRWAFIVGVTALAFLLGAIYVTRQTPLYTATAQLLLDPRKEKAAGPDSVFTDTALDLFVVENQMAIIRSTALLSRVVEKERLVADAEFGATAQASALPSGTPSAVPPKRAGDAGADSFGPENMSPAMTAATEMLKGSVTATRAGLASVINVSFTSDNADKSARIANAVADAYVVDKLDARFEAAKRASSWLNDRLVELRQQLRDSEEAVAKFRSDNNLVQAAPGATLNQDQMAQLNARLVTARSETAEKKARLDLLKRVESQGGNIGSIADIMNSSFIAELRRQENDESRQEAELLARYTGSHPLVVNIRAQLADIRRNIDVEVHRLAGDVKNEYDLAVARQAAVEKTLREVTGQTDLDASKAISLRELERTASVNKSLFEDFLQRARVTQEQSTFEARDARIITPALPPGAPSSPKRTQIMVTSLLLGLMAGVGGAYLLEILNAGFTTPRQVEDMLELPLLASLAKMDPASGGRGGAPLSLPEYPLAKPLARFSESVRSLRSAIQMSDVDSPPKILQITSTVPNEGKTTIALMIAASAAHSGQRVLVIDCDLRRPSASNVLGLEKAAGLVEYLTGEADLQKVLIFSEKLRIWVLPAGGKTQNQPDLLASERMKALIAATRPKYDLVLIDTPPMGPVVDPLIVSNLVDKVIYVVRWASTAREMVQHSIQKVSGHKKVAGVVFNHVVESHAQKYGKYAYSYYYGSRYYKKYYRE